VSPNQTPERDRRLYALAAAAVVVLGLGSRRWAFVPEFFAVNAGDALWTVEAFLVLAILFRRAPSYALGLAAFGVSALVELSQLYRAPWLTDIRDTTLGALLLGSGFLWVDFLRYAVGAGVAYIIDSRLSRLSLRKNTPSDKQ
jgi:glycopeptide antibiotics resistance protein